jgi:hypothetical protein
VKRVASSALAVGCILLLAGCASADNNNLWGEYFQILKDSVAGTFGDRAVTREQAAGIPYATMGYRMNGGPQMMIVLATDTNGDLLWTSASHIVLLTHAGRIIRTVGLPHDISGVAPLMGNSLPAPAAVLKGAFTSTRAVDFPDTGSYSVPISCKMMTAGRETISILGQPIATLRADESCTSSGWSFRDSFWIDPTSGFVWRSLQHLTPKGDTIETEILRPPG